MLYIYTVFREPSTIRILGTTPLHRQRKGRRRKVTVLDHDELLERFELTALEPEVTRTDALKAALDSAGWPYHEDALGKLWAVAPEAR